MTIDLRLAGLLSVHENESLASPDHIRLTLLEKLASAQSPAATVLPRSRLTLKRKLVLAAVLLIMFGLLSIGVYSLVKQPTLEERYPDLNFPEVSYSILNAEKLTTSEVLSAVEVYQSSEEVLIIRSLESIDDITLEKIGDMVGGSSSISRSAGTNTILVIYYGGRMYHIYYHETNQIGFSDYSDAEILDLLKDDLDEFIKISIVVDQTGEYPDLD